MDEKLQNALGELREAHEFLEKCRKDGDYAVTTGALRDAREWVNDSVAAVVAAMPPKSTAK